VNGAGLPDPSRARAATKVLLGLVAGVVVVCAVGWFTGVDPRKMIAHARDAPPLVLVLCCLSSLVMLALQTWRWHAVFSPLLGLSYSDGGRRDAGAPGQRLGAARGDHFQPRLPGAQAGSLGVPAAPHLGIALLISP
jgi:hypothetical protein